MGYDSSTELVSLGNMTVNNMYEMCCDNTIRPDSIADWLTLQITPQS